MTFLAATSPRLRWTAVVLWMGVIFWLSAQPTLPRPPGAAPSLVSILGHLVAYAILAALLAWALDHRARPRRATLLVAWAVSVLYGVTDEVHQSFVPNRYPDVRDVLTDALGAALALVAISWLSPRLSSHLSPSQDPRTRVAPGPRAGGSGGRSRRSRRG